MSAFLSGISSCLLFVTPVALAAEPSDVGSSGESVAADRDDGQPPLKRADPAAPIAVPASPAAVDKVPGTGALGRWLGLPADSPWRLGGVWVGNGSEQLGGGMANPGGLGLAQQFLLDLSLDLDRSIGWQGASVWVQGR